MKTPEQIAAEINECAESIIRNLREDIAPELREDTWVWTAACHAKVIKDDIAALTEHAAQIERERDGWRETAERYAKNDIDRRADLAALRAVADDMAWVLERYRGQIDNSGVSGHEEAALTRYAALRAGEKGAV